MRLHPEEKLLRLIRGKGQPSPESRQEEPAAQSGTAGRTERARARWQLPARWLTGLNLGLGCLVGGELVVLLLIATRPIETVPVDSARTPTPIEPLQQPPEHSITPLASVVSRPMFQTASAPGATSRPGGSAAPSTQANTLAARLTLIGIVAGEPAQAIIEDTQTKKTHFVTVGQSLIEGLSVEEILADRVILDLGGEKLELSL